MGNAYEETNSEGMIEPAISCLLKMLGTKVTTIETQLERKMTGARDLNLSNNRNMIIKLNTLTSVPTKAEVPRMVRLESQVPPGNIRTRKSG